MNKMLKSVALMAAMIAAGSSFAEIIHHDDKDFYVDEQGVEHQLFYEKGNAEKIWGLSTYADQEFQIQASLTEDGILVTLPSETYAVSWPFDITCYGIDFRKGIGAKWEKIHRFGAYGIRSSVGGWTLNFYNGSLRLTASQTWSGPEATELSDSPFVIQTSYSTPTTYPAGIFAEEDGLTLTLAGDLRLVIQEETPNLSTTDVIVKKPAVLTLRKHDKGTMGRLHAHKLTLDGGAGFYFGKETSSDTKGSIAELSVERVAQTLELKNDASLMAYGTTSVSVTGGVTVVAAAGSSGAVVGTYVLKDDETVFKAEADATLDLSGATISGGAASVQGPGKVVFDFSRNVPAGGCSFSGDCVLGAKGDNAFIDCGLAGLVVEVSGVLSMSDAAAAAFSGSVITVKSGVLYIPHASSIPSGVMIVTEGTGTLCLRDSSGFDPATRMGGTKSVSDGTSGLVVTDAPRTDEQVTVAAGQTLMVCGNGLVASSALDLQDGAKVFFADTATVAAPVATAGTVSFLTAASSVTGTVAGVITAASGTIQVDSPGLLRITGGGKIGVFTMQGGNVEIEGPDLMSFGGVNMIAGYIRLKSFWGFIDKADDSRSNWICFSLGQATQKGDVTLEIATGGHLKLLGSHYLDIGRDPNWKSRVYINGGRLTRYVRERFLLNRHMNGSTKVDNNGNGILEIDNGGELATASSLECGTSTGPHRGIIFGTGTWSSRDVMYAYRFGKKGDVALIVGGNTPVTVKGHMTFDMSNFGEDVRVTTNQAASATGTWTCEKDGKISVRGGRTLVLRDVSEMALDLTMEPYVKGGPSVGNIIFCNSAAAEEEVPPTAVTWTLQKYVGGQQGTVTATGEGGKTGPLVASYVVPEGVTFDGSQTNGWYEGFTSQTLGSLVFEAGSAYRFAPFAADFAPLVLAGTLTLPETMDYYLTADGTRRDFRSEPVIVPAGGVEGDCVWTCRGDAAARPKNAALSSASGQVLFDYLMPGVLLLVR